MRNYDVAAETVLTPSNDSDYDPELPPIEAYAQDVGSASVQSVEASSIEVVRLSTHELLAPIEPERYLLPGLVPTEAYTLIAGALSSYKSTLLDYLCLWKATGFDLLDLDPTKAGCDIGPALLIFYEDAQRRVTNRRRRIVQHGHDVIRQVHGAKAASQFVERAARNMGTIALTGKAKATIVYRGLSGQILPNEELIGDLITAARTMASSGVMVAIDPLRLAIVGSQNDDDGADVVVHTLNRMAMMLADSGLIVCAHTTKADAKDPAGGYAGAAYATSGSALYSQHARSNFLMARLKADEARTLVDSADLERQPVARLTHGRLSHGAESSAALVQMRGGVLVPISPRKEFGAADKMMAFGPLVARALDRLLASNTKASANALMTDPEVRAHGTQRDLKELLKLLEQNDYIAFDGNTVSRTGRLTAKGRAVFASN